MSQDENEKNKVVVLMEAYLYIKVNEATMWVNKELYTFDKIKQTKV